MKCVILLCLLGAAAVSAQTPIARVVGLIEGIKAKVEADGKAEQQSYDKYACWCEKTLARKASDIENAETSIASLQDLITKTKGELGTHNAEVAQLKKDIASNAEAQKDATALRDKENAAFNAEKNENEQCTGALEMAVGVLSGAGEGKFLQKSYHEAQLLSVVAGVRSVLSSSVVKDQLSEEDLSKVKHFVEQPEAYTGQQMSAAQIAKNPNGEYAPQSSAIQGILKGMYDAFTADIEKDNAEESDAQKAFTELMATKAQEQATLEASLEAQTKSSADKTKLVADSEAEQDDTKAQLESDEVFFADTKKTCKEKASLWAERTRLRTEELQGMVKAVEILSSPEAQKTFQSSGNTFVQLSSVTTNSQRNGVYSKLSNLAAKYNSLHLAEIAVAVKSGGHFDKVMGMIDNMIEILRKEEASDIEHKDRCEAQRNANANAKADLAHDIAKTNAELERQGDKKDQLNEKIDALDALILKTKGEMKELLKMRNEEVKEFKQAVKDDTDAVKLMGMAIESLSSFYKRNKLPLDLVQKKGPEYSVDSDKAPDAGFGGDYGGRKSESGGLIAILSMLKEDVEKEIEESRADDADAEASYEKDNGALKNVLAKTKTTKVQTEAELSDLVSAMADNDELKDQKNGDLGGQNDVADTLTKDCTWVEEKFDDRMAKRKTEISGLEDAKNILGGQEPADDLSME